jgi:hypothetical protein
MWVGLHRPACLPDTPAFPFRSDVVKCGGVIGWVGEKPLFWAPLFQVAVVGLGRESGCRGLGFLNWRSGLAFWLVVEPWFDSVDDFLGGWVGSGWGLFLLFF